MGNGDQSANRLSYSFSQLFCTVTGETRNWSMFIAPRDPRKNWSDLCGTWAHCITLCRARNFQRPRAIFPLALLKEIALPIRNVLTSKYWITSRCLPFRCRMIAVSLSLSPSFSSNKENNVSILWKYFRSVYRRCCEIVVVLFCFR